MPRNIEIHFYDVCGFFFVRKKSKTKGNAASGLIFSVRFPVALPLVLLISKLEYFDADAPCIICIFQGKDLRVHMNLC
jgi:hypothetical protein